MKFKNLFKKLTLNTEAETQDIVFGNVEHGFTVQIPKQWEKIESAETEPKMQYLCCPGVSVSFSAFDMYTENNLMRTNEKRNQICMNSLTQENLDRIASIHSNIIDGIELENKTTEYVTINNVKYLKTSGMRIQPPDTEFLFAMLHLTLINGYYYYFYYTSMYREWTIPKLEEYFNVLETVVYNSSDSEE